MQNNCNSHEYFYLVECDMPHKIYFFFFLDCCKKKTMANFTQGITDPKKWMWTIGGKKQNNSGQKTN